MQILAATTQWWRNLSRTVKIIGGVGVIGGAIVSVAQAWPIVEPYVYAARGYVRDYDAEQIKPLNERLVRIQLSLNRERRQQLLDEAAKRALELQSPQAQQLPEYKALVQDRVNRISEELKNLDADDDSLFKQHHK